MEGPSPEALNISADGGSYVSTPVLSHVHVHGDVNFSTSYSGIPQPPPPTQDSHHQLKISGYKTDVLTAYETVQDYNSLPGEDVPLAERYTELLIIQKHRLQKEREKELRSRGEMLQDVFKSRAAETDSHITLDKLFKPNDHRPVPRAVILQGHSGHGKSFTVKKIMYDWASELLFKDFILTFHLECKELNHISGKQSLVDLLRCDQEFTPVILKILRDSPGKVLFLIDGFDELRYSLNELSSVLPSDPSEHAPIEATLCALLNGSILRQSFVLVTTRSTVSDKLSELLKKPQRFTEILGFTEDGVKQYFQRFFEDRMLSHKVYQYVRANEKLFTSCFIPVICSIVCTVLKEHFEESVDAQDKFETTSSIFVHFINTLMKYHCEGFRMPKDELTLLRSLGQLAEGGMEEHQVLFDESTVSKVLPDFNKRNPFLCKFMMKKKVDRETLYSFMHLSFQEFFAALQYLLIDQKQACEKLQKLLDSTVEVDLFNQRKENWRDQVIQFLFGLSNCHLQFVKSSCLQAIRTLMQEWLLNVIKMKREGISITSQPAVVLFIIHCLYEMHEKEFIMSVFESLGGLCFGSHDLQRTDYWVLQYCILCCHSIKTLSLYKLTAENLRIVGPALCKCKELWFKIDLSDSDVGDLTSALGEGKIIHELRIENSLSAESVELILRALQKQKSVTFIHLRNVKAVTLNIAVMSVHLIQTTKKLKQCSNFVWIGENYKTPRQKDSLCMMVSVSKEARSFSFTLAWRPATEDSDITFTLDLTLWNQGIIDVREYLQKCHNLHENHTTNDEHVEALFSSLHSDANLKHLKDRVRCLTLGQTVGRLSLQTFPNLKEVRVAESKLGTDCTTLSFVGVNNHSVDTIITFGSRASVPYVSVRLSSSSDMSTCDFIDFILTFDAYVTRCSGTTQADNDGVEAPLSSLCSVSGLKNVEVEASSITFSLAAGALCLIQTHPSLQTVKIVRSPFHPLPTKETQIHQPAAEETSYYCSSLCITKDTNTQSLNIEIATEKYEATVSYILLSMSQSSAKSADLKDLFLKFHSLDHLDDLGPQLEDHRDALISSLNSLPGLRQVELEVDSLTVSWAKRILSFIQSCPTLQKIHVEASGFWWTRSVPVRTGGFLAEEGIRLLQMSMKRPDCTLILAGNWCSKTRNQCSEALEWGLSCNMHVEITIIGTSLRRKRRTVIVYGQKGMKLKVKKRSGGRKKKGRREGQNEEQDCSNKEGEGTS